MDKKESIGIKNNNPLNIRRSSQKFINEQKSDNDFKKFSSMVYGVRAAIRIIHTYYFNYRYNTIEKIISRWVPPMENSTKNYIDIVSKRSHILPNVIVIYTKDNILSIIKAMAYVESHVELSKEILEEAWKLAQDL